MAAPEPDCPEPALTSAGASHTIRELFAGCSGRDLMGRSKADLANVVYDVHGGLSRRDATLLVDLIFIRIRAALATGRPVLISGFGTFKVLKRDPRLGRNPRTGETVPIAATRRPVFRPSRLMVRSLNAAGDREGRLNG